MCFILFVDDDEVATDIGARMLHRLGYDVMPVVQSTKALDIFRKKPSAFDLVITDYMMPVMKGNELASELRSIRTDIPLLLCTGYAGISEWDVHDWGFDGQIVKPYKSREMAGMIKQIMKRRQIDCKN